MSIIRVGDKVIDTDHEEIPEECGVCECHEIALADIRNALGMATVAKHDDVISKIQDLRDVDLAFDKLARALGLTRAYSSLSRDESPPCNCGYGCPPSQGCRHP